MKKQSKRILLGTLGLISIVIIAFVLYFYIGFSGNPFVGYQQQRAVIRIYENKYGEDFTKISSSYDYKRDEFSFRLSSKSHPEIIFETTLNEAERIDRYAQSRSIEYLKKVISDSLGNDFDHLQYRVNVYEEYASPGIMEQDPINRLSQNKYVVDFSWDTTLLDSKQVDVTFSKMAQRIADRLDTPVGGLKIRAGVWDSKDYYYVELDLN